jgi:hypothetical protein
MSDNGHRTGQDPDPLWDLGDLDDARVDDAGRRRVPWWVIVLVILIALALILQLAWPLVADLLDRGGDSGGFPTPGVI